MDFKKNIKYNFKKIQYTNNTNNTNSDFISYRLKNPLLILNKIRRLMVARVKKIIKKKKIIKTFWLKLGKVVFLFKKGLNLRMGKGDGSMFSVRRLYQNGSFILLFESLRFGFHKFILRYVKSKLHKNISIYVNINHSNKKIFRKLKFIKKNIYFFKKSKRFHIKFNYTFKNKQIFLWKLTYRFYRRYVKKSILYSSNFFFFKKYRKCKYKNNSKKLKYLYFFLKKNKYFYNFWKLKFNN